MKLQTITSSVNRTLLSGYKQTGYSWGSLFEADACGVMKAGQEAKQFLGPFIEFGTLFGHTTNLLATLKNQKQTLISIDNYSWNPFCMPRAAHLAFAQRTTSVAKQFHNTVLLDMSLDEFKKTYRGERPAFVFLDADHSYDATFSDIQWAIEQEAHVICGHDYHDSCPGVIEAVKYFFGNEIELYNRVWIAK